MRVRTTPSGAIIVDALYIDASEEKIGIFTNTPQYTLDVTGDLRVTGNMLVEGDTTTVETAVLKVEDKNIELGHVAGDTPTYGNNATVSGGGLTLLSSDTNKTFTWETTANAWTSSVNIDLSDTSTSYKIGNVEKVLNDRLGSSIIYATGLVRVGTLEYLNVDSLAMDANTMQSSISSVSYTHLRAHET